MLDRWLDRLAKEAGFAPGLPHKTVRHPIATVTRPDVWQFGLHDHHSEGGAGHHLDLRLGHPASGHAHSWAMRYWPEPGEARLAIQQPTHTIPYMDFQGRLESGYGKGQVDLARRSKTDIHDSSKDHVRFSIPGEKGTEHYLLHRTDGNKWLLRNMTDKQGTKTAAQEIPMIDHDMYEAMAHELTKIALEWAGGLAKLSPAEVAAAKAKQLGKVDPVAVTARFAKKRTGSVLESTGKALARSL